MALSYCDPLSLITDKDVRRSFGGLDLRAHLLKTRSQSFDLLFLFCDPGFKTLLLLCHSRFQLQYFAMFSEKLIEQHRVDCVIAHAIDLAVLVAHHQIGVHRSDVLGNQSKLGRACLIGFVTKRYRLKRQHRFAGLVHRFNLFFEPPGRTDRAELASVGYDDWLRGAAQRGCAKYVGNPSCVACVFPHGRADADNIISCGNAATCPTAYGYIIVPSGVIQKRIDTDSRV